MVPIFLLLAMSALAAERVFELTPPASAQNTQELATIVRSILELDVQADGGKGTIGVSGAEERIAVAEWLIAELDRAGDRKERSAAERTIAGVTDGTVRLIPLRHAVNFQDLQELATAVRAVCEVRRLFVSGRRGTLALRDRAEALDAASWLAKELDEPGERGRASEEYRMPGVAEGAIQVFHPSGVTTPQQLQELAVAVRRATGARRLFTTNRNRAIAVRGSEEQVRHAGQLCR